MRPDELDELLQAKSLGGHGPLYPGPLFPCRRDKSTVTWRDPPFSSLFSILVHGWGHPGMQLSSTTYSYLPQGATRPMMVRRGMLTDHRHTDFRDQSPGRYSE